MEYHTDELLFDCLGEIHIQYVYRIEPNWIIILSITNKGRFTKLLYVIILNQNPKVVKML